MQKSTQPRLDSQARSHSSTKLTEKQGVSYFLAKDPNKEKFLSQNFSKFHTPFNTARLANIKPCKLWVSKCIIDGVL